MDAAASPRVLPPPPLDPDPPPPLTDSTSQIQQNSSIPGDHLAPEQGEEGWTRVSRRRQPQIYPLGQDARLKGWEARRPKGGNPGQGAAQVPGSRTGQLRSSQKGWEARRPKPNARSVPPQQQRWSFQANSAATPWNVICTTGNKIDDVYQLDFIQPEISLDGKVKAKIPRSEIDSNVGRWNNTLVGYVVGDKPFYQQIKACVSRIWKPTCSLEIHSRENGCFFFRFGEAAECDRVLQSGPWLFDGRLIVLKKWSACSGLDRDLLSTVPIWVRLPSLHLQFWSKAIISRIASVIGTPIRMDKATASAERLSFARCFIEVSAASPLPSSVSLCIEEGEELDIQVEYECIPPSCPRCVSFGHTIDQCPYKVAWQPKRADVPPSNQQGAADEVIQSRQPATSRDPVQTAAYSMGEVAVDGLSTIQEDVGADAMGVKATCQVGMEQPQVCNTTFIHSAPAEKSVPQSVDTNRDQNNSVSVRIDQRHSVPGPSCIAGRSITDIVGGGEEVDAAFQQEKVKSSGNNSINEKRTTSTDAGVSHWEDDWENEDPPPPDMLVEDNPEWLAMLAKANLESLNRQSKKKKKGGGIALVPPRRSSRFLGSG